MSAYTIMKERRPSIKDVAQKANVSIATVSHVLNKTRYVSDETTQRVMNAMVEVNYHSNAVAKALRQNKTHTVGVIIPDIVNPFFSNLVNYIEMELNKFGYTVILCHSRDNLEQELACVKKLNSWSVDGIIIAPASPDYDYAELREREAQCPIVFVDRQPNTSNYNGVFFDIYRIFEEATAKLIDAGHRKIGFVHGPIRFSTTGDRLRGYESALALNGIPVDQKVIFCADTSIAGGYRAMEQLMSNTDMTAVIVANSRMCLGAMRYLGEKQVRIPEDLAIIGFETTEWADIVQPALTSIRETVDEMGISAAKLMMKILRNPDCEKQQIYLNPYLTKKTSY